MRFRDKVVWVTGASSGIGEALALAFSREGARLVLSSRNEAELERVRQNCETDLATDRAIMNLNFFGTIGLTKAVLPSMLARKSGHIVPISSVVGYVGTPLRSTYSASKHALHGFFDSLRAEVAKDGIDITIVCPGYIRTNVSRNALTGDGTSFGKMDRTHESAMSPVACARRVVNAVAAKKEEIVVGGKETWAVPLKRLTPRLVSRMVRMK